MTTVREQLVAGARKWLGTPYTWGGESAAEGGVDCSGLIIATYRDAGRPLTGRPIASQLGKMGEAVSLAQAQPGDVVYYDKPGATDHVGLYVGDGKMINAPYSGTNVRYDSVGAFTSIRRLVTGGGAAAGGGGITYTPDGVPVPAGTQTEPVTDAYLEENGGSLLDAINPFDTWAADGMALGLKILATGLAGTLLVVGAVKAVGGS